MEIALIIGRLVLAAVFTVAGLTKARDLAGSRAALTEFGVPKSVAGPGALLLPIVELIVAVGLLPAATAVWGALGALVLLLLFTAAIAVSLARGRRPACRCFGQLSAEPVGRATLVRNGILTALAALVAWRSWSEPPQSLLSWLGQLGAGEAVLIFAILAIIGSVVVLFWLLLQVIRQQGRLLLRIDELEQRLASIDGHAAHHAVHADTPPESEGLPLDTPAPNFALLSLDGERHSLADLLQPNQPLLLVFTDPTCGPCTALLPEIGGWQRALERRVKIAIIGRGTVAANRAHAVEHDVSPVLLQLEDEVADAYRVYGTPGAVLVRPDGTIGSPVAGGPEPIRSLVMHTATNPQGPTWSPLLLLPMAGGTADHKARAHDHMDRRASGLPVGDPAPEFELRDLDGRPVRLSDRLGSPTLVLFWNPGCAFCHRLLPEMLAWEANLGDAPTQLLVISEGTTEANRALGFRASVAIDDTLAVGEQFGVSGTPSAILIDAKGAVASSLAVGGPDILALAQVALSTPGFSNSPVSERSSA